MTPNIAATEQWMPREEHKTVTKAAPRKYEILYWNVIFIILYHISAFYGVYLACTSAKWSTVLFSCITFIIGLTGIGAGAHRLWSHKSYTATTPLQIFLMVCYSLNDNYTIFQWARDHRLHHKYSDTDADPYNASRGFFYSHIGWLMVRKHPEVISKGKQIDVSDLKRNPVVMWQYRNRVWFINLMTFVLPTIIQMYFWGESFKCAWYLNMARYVLIMHVYGSVNSVAHMWGYRPFDKNIAPVKNRIFLFLTWGESNHNYHHVFPTDYRQDEFGYLFNFNTHFIDMCARLGLARDLKSAPISVVSARIRRTGDGTHPEVAI